MSLKEYGELCNLIGFTAQEYVQLNEKYEKLIFGLEDLQSSYSYIHSADSNEIKLSPHQAEVLLDILEELDREHRLTDEGVELLAYLYDATDKHHSQKHSELSTTSLAQLTNFPRFTFRGKSFKKHKTKVSSFDILTPMKLNCTRIKLISSVQKFDKARLHLGLLFLKTALKPFFTCGELYQHEFRNTSYHPLDD